MQLYGFYVIFPTESRIYESIIKQFVSVHNECVLTVLIDGVIRSEEIRLKLR